MQQNQRVMIKNPILSICIPAYNRPLWFQRGLQSIVEGNQVARSRVEISIADDSDDRTCEAIAEDILKGWSWCYEHHPIALGMAQNWNRAIALAQGRYVMVLHDDDFFVPGGIDRLLVTLDRLEDKYAVLLFGALVVDAQEQVMKRQVFSTDRYLSSKEALIRLFSDSSFVRFPAIVFQRSVLKVVGGFRPEWREPCDVEMWRRLFAHCGVYCCREITVSYRVHSEALTMEVFNEETIALLLELFSEVSQMEVLSSEELKRCKSLFLYQFILAGAWRQLRRGDWQNFQRVIRLFDCPGIKSLDCPNKWLLFRIGFGVLSRVRMSIR